MWADDLDLCPREQKWVSLSDKDVEFYIEISAAISYHADFDFFF